LPQHRDCQALPGPRVRDPVGQWPRHGGRFTGFFFLSSSSSSSFPWPSDNPPLGLRSRVGCPHDRRPHGRRIDLTCLIGRRRLAKLAWAREMSRSRRSRSAARWAPAICSGRHSAVLLFSRSLPCGTVPSLAQALHHTTAPWSRPRAGTRVRQVTCHSINPSTSASRPRADLARSPRHV